MTQNNTYSDQDIALVSETILKARKNCKGLSQFPGKLPKNLDTAYRIQDLSISNWNDKIIGWKVGGIPPDQQAALGNTKLGGPIYKDYLQHYTGTRVSMPIYAEGYAAIEAEFIIELADCASLPATGLEEKQLLEVVSNMYIGVEIASSPIQNINGFGPVGPVSDFGNNTGLIVGSCIDNWRDVALSSVDVIVNIDGEIHGPTRVGPGLDGPLGSVKFLIENLKQRGYDIPSGTLVSCGAITGVHDANLGAVSSIEFVGLGKIELELTQRLPV